MWSRPIRFWGNLKRGKAQRKEASVKGPWVKRAKTRTDANPAASEILKRAASPKEELKVSPGCKKHQ